MGLEINLKVGVKLLYLYTAILTTVQRLAEQQHTGLTEWVSTGRVALKNPSFSFKQGSAQASSGESFSGDVLGDPKWILPHNHSLKAAPYH